MAGRRECSRYSGTESAAPNPWAARPDRELLVARTLGLDVRAERTLVDYTGRAVRLKASQLPRKLGKFANHTAYAGWIEPTLRSPLEVWQHADPRKPGSSVRRYYLAAYLSPAGATSHLLIAAVAGGVLFNCYRLDGANIADESRFGDLLHLGYAPIYPPLPSLKGAPFPVAPFV